jgi:hypothetical protein
MLGFEVRVVVCVTSGALVGTENAEAAGVLGGERGGGWVSFGWRSTVLVPETRLRRHSRHATTFEQTVSEWHGHGT